MNMVKKKNKIMGIRGLKKEFEKQGLKIGKEAILKFMGIEEAKISKDIASLVRKANILGRKVVREEDLKL